MKPNTIDFSLMLKQTPKQPTTEYLLKEFENFLEYMEKKGEFITIHAWIRFLNVTRDMYNSWIAPISGLNKVEEEEYNNRKHTMKKIAEEIERSLSETMISSERTNGNIMFYMKNAFKWRDKPEEEPIQVNIKNGKVLPNKPRNNNNK